MPRPHKDFRRSSGAGFRGQPVLMLVALLLGWTALRFFTFEPPFFERGLVFSHRPNSWIESHRPSPVTPRPRRSQQGQSAQGDVPPHRAEPIEPAWRQPPPAILLPRLAPVAPPAPFPVAAGPTPQTAERAPARMAVGHNLLLAAGLAGMPVPPILQAYFDQSGAAAPAAPPPAAAPHALALDASGHGPRRWSADGWVLWRAGAGAPLLASSPSYGRSQAGAVIRFDLARANVRRPQAHLRGSTALAGTREVEAAAGLSVRLASVPLRLGAEMRVGESGSRRTARPAAFAVTELPPVSLPLAARGEAYLQAGYVGGDFATYYVDGQARVDRALVASADPEIRAGAGVWGGAQRGTARLDVGPTASIGFDVGEARAKLAANYRFRIAGDARPLSGPALTLSAGF